MSRFPVSRNIVIIFAYLCVNKIAYIIIGETLGTMQTCAPIQTRCTALLWELYTTLPCTALLSYEEPGSPGKEAVKSAPSCKEEILSVLHTAERYSPES